jgi:hypothetical protein
MVSLQNTTIRREATVPQAIRCGQELMFVWALCGHKTRWSGAARIRPGAQNETGDPTEATMQEEKPTSSFS